MAVTSAKYVDLSSGMIAATIDGQVMSVPVAGGNRHYQMILGWVADGNTITAADPAPTPETESERIDSQYNTNSTFRAQVNRDARVRGISVRAVLDELKSDL